MAVILPNLVKGRLGKGSPIVRKASACILLARRTLAQLVSNGSGDKTILFIFGCQRSGTTMLSRIFEGDARVSPFAEHSSELARDDHPLRLRDLESVGELFQRCRGQLVVVKPLVESQRADEILDHFSSARSVWMYRDFRDVARSYVRIFGRAGINISRKIATEADNWSSERLPDAVREVVRSFYSEEMSVLDAAALFWWVRNGWFFDLNLRENRRVMLCRYETLVSSPDPVMRAMYEFLGLTYPGSYLVNGIHRSSKGLGESVNLDPAIDKLCTERLAALDEAAGITERFTA